MTKQQIESLKTNPIRTWYAYYNALCFKDWGIDLACNLHPDWSEDHEDYWQVKGKNSRVLKFIGTSTQATNYFNVFVKAL